MAWSMVWSMALPRPAAHCRLAPSPQVSLPRASRLSWRVSLPPFCSSPWGRSCSLPSFPLPNLARFRACNASLFAKRAFRIEVADPAAFAAGRRIDHRIDQCRLARIHGGVDLPLELVRCRRVDADAAKGLDHLVVA